jgi:hypothetical protein
MRPLSRHPRSATRPGRPPLLLHELLGEVSRRPTRLELVCWEFNIDESDARPAWHAALRVGLIAPAGNDRYTGERVFGLTERGHRALRELRATPRR